MFNFIKQRLQKIYVQVTSKLAQLLGTHQIDAQLLAELEKILLAADAGVKATRSIIDQLQAQCTKTDMKKVMVRDICASILRTMLTTPQPFAHDTTKVFILVGINGSGKTTFAGKLAHYWKQRGKRVALVAADTFRAAAPEQLLYWAEQSAGTIITGAPGQDPAAVVYTGCQTYIKDAYDILIIDTAGRLHTKVNLMHELAKIKRVVSKQLPNEHIGTLLVLDTMLGQSSFEQAKLFQRDTAVNGVVLTKMDGTGKGGIVFAIVQELDIPIAYVTFGEQVDHIKIFDPNEYVHNLINQ